MLLGAGAMAGVAAAAPMARSQAAAPVDAGTRASKKLPDVGAETRAERMKWWHEAKFGMFIHFGTYATIMRKEWDLEMEAIPTAEYVEHAKTFRPGKDSPRAWAKLAKKAGMKYMVLTTKHHEGFCNWDTKLTDYNIVKQGAGFDLVREYVDAVRAEGLKVGFYYSLMDWHHPDGAKCATDEAARRRFVDYTHGLLRELMTNYGTIDVLWYDVAWPLDAAGWESVKMNEMVYGLQPKIIINNRNKLPGDFSTPEQKIEATERGRAWESCMTLNGSWGFCRADDEWKTPRTVVRNLITCVRDDGNYLLNIGPKPDGSIPAETTSILTEVGAWLARNGEVLAANDPCAVTRSNYALFSRKGNTLYMHVALWVGDYVAIGGLKTKVKSARLLRTGKAVAFEQDDWRVKLTGLPAYGAAPDTPLVTIALECEGEPVQDEDHVRREKPRAATA
jgi:alpha-L-fucosidase